MAGDWIKVECATLDKPEVTLFAELLGIPVDQGLGLLVRFWVWLDRNSRNGDVTHVSRSSIDTVMHTPGFGAALEAVGWAQFNETARSIHMPNFDRHNGKPAKTRAQTKTRVAEHRKRNGNADTVTREELEKSTTSLRSVGARRIAQDWQPSPVDLAFAQERLRGDAIAGQAEAFRSYWTGAVKNATSPDWSAKWRTWILKAVRDYGAAAPDAPRRAAL